MKSLFLPLALMAATPAFADDQIWFHSPSNNIHCLIDAGAGEVRCDMVTVTNQSFGRKPADCQGDWGHSFSVGKAGKGYPGCVSDTVVNPGSFTLDYGKAVTLAGITCSSEKTGVTCRNGAGHGFSLAKAGQKVF